MVWDSQRWKKIMHDSCRNENAFHCNADMLCLKQQKESHQQLLLTATLMKMKVLVSSDIQQLSVVYK